MEHLPLTYTLDTLQGLATEYGPITYAKLWKATGFHVGLVRFVKAEDAEQAMLGIEGRHFDDWSLRPVCSRWTGPL